jgi:hypothetical protein
VNTLLYAQLLSEIISILLCLRKERLHIPTLFVDFFIDVRVLSANSGSVQPNTRIQIGVQDFPLVRIYKLFKQDFCTEFYLKYIMSVCTFQI